MSFLPNQAQEPLYYPVRPNSHFTSSSQHSHQNQQQQRYRDEHEMTSVRNPNQANSSNKNKKKPTQQHAFGDDSDDEEEQAPKNDSDSDEDDGQGFGVYKDTQESDKRYKNVNIDTNVYRDDPYAQNRTDSNGYLNSPSTTVGGGTPNYLQTGESSSLKKPMEYKKSDLVHMPALGSDWAPDEGRNDKDWEGKPQMIDKPKWANRKNEMANAQAGVRNSIREWLAGRNKACGWFGRIQGLVLLVILLITLALMLYFFIPRVPSLAYNNQQLMVGDNSTASFKRADPIGFSFDAKINLAFDARNSYLSPKVSNLVVIVEDLSTAGALEIGRGNSDQDVISLNTKDYTPFSATVHFKYSASAITDPLWSSYYTACAHMWPGNSTRPTVNLAIGVSYKVSGISGEQFESTVLNSIGCPVELSANAA